MHIHIWPFKWIKQSLCELDLCGMLCSTKKRNIKYNQRELPSSTRRAPGTNFVATKKQIRQEIKAKAEFSVSTVMNPIKVKIGTYGRNNFRALRQGEEGMKGRTKTTHYDKNAITWHTTHPSPCAPHQSASCLLIYFSVASNNNTNTKKHVTVVTSAVHSHIPLCTSHDGNVRA